MGFLQEFREFIHPHYVFNLALSISFFVLKTTTPFCYLLFEDCSLELREMELLTFLGCVIVLKNRKQPSYRSYIGTTCMFAKILNALLYVRQNPLMGIIYILVCLVHMAFLPEPVYSGPESVIYFRDNKVEDEIKSDPRVTWLIEFYAAWSPNCVSFAPTFSQLSADYGLDNLKFAKVDVSRFPDMGEKFNVSASSWSKQLPTVVLFQQGKESRRRPACNTKGSILQKFMFSKENMINDFELNEIHLQCKKNPLKKTKKSNLNEPTSTQSSDTKKTQ